MSPPIPFEPIYEVRCSVRRCDWRITCNTPDPLVDAWALHRALHIREQDG